MPIYWSMFFVTILMGGLTYFAPNKVLVQGNKKICDLHYLYAVMTFGYIVFFCGLRDRVLDTSAYISAFKYIPDTWNEMWDYVFALDIGKGFYLLSGVFKVWVSSSHYIWLFALALVSVICLLRIYYKRTVDFSLTAYLFIATTTFTWLINGTRQFLAVCILFAFSDLLLEGKKFKYILIICLMTTIHSSAIFMIPIVFFVSSKEVFGKKMLFFSLITIIGTYYSDSVFSFLTNEILNEEYSLASSDGSNVIRLLVEIIPIVIMLINMKNVRDKATPDIILATNMSFVGACFSFASTLTNGILVGRMPIYFTVYNLYLLPWLIKKCFVKKSQTIVGVCCIIMYALYFYYQMEVAWGGLEYCSEILRLNFN